MTDRLTYEDLAVFYLEAILLEKKEKNITKERPFMSYDAFLLAVERVADRISISPAAFLSESLLPHAADFPKGRTGGLLSTSVKVTELCQAYRRPLKAVYLHYAMASVEGAAAIDINGGSVEAWAIWRREIGPSGLLSGLTGAFQLSDLEALFLDTGSLPDLPKSSIAVAFEEALDVEGAVENLLLPEGGRGLSASGFVDALVRCTELSLVTGWDEFGETFEAATLHSFGCVVASILSSPLFAKVEAFVGAKLEQMLKGETLEMEGFESGGHRKEAKEEQSPAERESTDVTEAYQVLKRHYREQVFGIFEAYGKAGIVSAAAMRRLAFDARLEGVVSTSQTAQAESFDLFLRILSHWSILCFDQPPYTRLISGSAEVAHELATRMLHSKEIKRTQKAGGLSSSQLGSSVVSDTSLMTSKPPSGPAFGASRRGSIPSSTAPPFGEDLDTGEVLASLRALFEAHARPMKGEDTVRLTNREFLRLLTASGLVGFSEGTVPMAGCELVFVQGLEDRKKKNAGASFSEFISQLDLFRERLNECLPDGGHSYDSLIGFISERLGPFPKSSPDKHASIQSLFALHQELFELVFSSFTMEAQKSGKQWGDGYYNPEGLMDLDGFNRFGDAFGLLQPHNGNRITLNLLRLLYESHARSRTSLEESSQGGLSLSALLTFSGFGQRSAPIEDPLLTAMDYGAFLKVLAAMSVIIAPTGKTDWPERLGKLLEVMCHSSGVPTVDNEKSKPTTIRKKTARRVSMSGVSYAKRAEEEENDDEEDGWGVGSFAYASSPVKISPQRTPPGSKKATSRVPDMAATVAEHDRRQMAYAKHVEQSPGDGNSYRGLHARRRASISAAVPDAVSGPVGKEDTPSASQLDPMPATESKPGKKANRLVRGYGAPLARYAARKTE